MIGGNLSVLAHDVGTKTQLNSAGKILFLEDVGEPVYRLDAKINQLRRAGYFDSIAALLLGAFTESDLKVRALKFYLFNLFKDDDFPVLDGLPIGHTNYNLPLIHGDYIKLCQRGLKIHLESQTNQTLLSHDSTIR